MSSGFWSGLFGRAGPDPPPDPAPAPAPAPSGPASPQRLAAELEAIVGRVNRAGGRMPEGAVVAVRETEDLLRPLLGYLQVNPATEAEMIQVRAIVQDYLPTSVDTFLALPVGFAASHRNRQGRTPAEELLDQLVLLIDATAECATAVYAGDAQALTNQGRFLRDRFQRSELDL